MKGESYMSTINLINDALNNGGIFSCPQTEPKKKAKLKMNEQKIHSIQELRNNFDAEVTLKKYKNGKLYKWLQQHYYETEAEAIRRIDANSSKLLEEISKTLGVSYSHMEYMSEIEKEHFLNKQEEIKKYTDDAEILKQAHLAAMNQDELALLINQKETLIYLCNNSFTVPITKDNISTLE